MLVPLGRALLLTLAPSDGVLHLELPPVDAARPVVVFELEGRARQVRLRPADVRAAGFEVRAWTEAGMSAVAPPAPSVWTGEFVGGEERLVARRTADGFDGWIVRPDGTSLRLEPLPALAPGAHRFFEDAGLAARCGAEESTLTQGGAFAPPPIAPELGPACLFEAEIAYDCDYQYYKAKASSVELTVATVELYTELVNAFFVRDVRIRHRITAVVVRTAPFYFPTGGGHLLDLFRAEWNTNQSGIPRDLAHLMTGKSANVIEYGGLAWVGVVCNVGLAYAWSMDSPSIVGHEVGHNWGAGHCHDPSPCNNMCGACLLIAPNTKEIIEAYRDAVGCLDHVLPDPGEVPPYAMPDAFFVRKHDQNGAGATLDVLANDHDGSCERVLLAAVDSPTPRGADVAILASGGPDGRDVLLYGTGDVPVLGVDPFTYTARDAGGATTVGLVEVTALPLDLAAYWPFDEGSGASAADRSRFGRDGALENGAGWGAGVYGGGGLALDGANDHVSVPSLAVPGDELSITAWVRRAGDQADWAGIVFSRAAGTQAGLRLGKQNELRYQWNDDPVTRAFDPGFALPGGVWCFVALVVDPARATLYLDDGGGLQSAEHVYPHVPQTFAGATYVGWDPANAARHFGGELDDVRVHDHALVRKQVERLVELGGRAVVPTPTDGGSHAVDGVPLTWVASPLAVAHEVYLGADWDAVRDADTTSPEYQGSFASASFTPPAFPPNSRRFWRVDEVVGAQRSRGEVWQLEVPRAHRWKLDETSGATAVDAIGAKDGTYKSGVTLGEPGATGKTGTSVRLDGADDRVRIPKLNLDDSRFTVAGWVRRDGAQAPFAGLFFCRGTSTTAGLHLGDADDLRYTWEGAHSDWSSGLFVPDDAWVFVALVVEPQRATIYLGQAGLLQAAEHPVSHGPEAFDAVSYVGTDPLGGRLFRGWTDDWRVFAGALSAAQLQTLYTSSL